MATSSTDPSTRDLLDGTLAVATGAGVVTMALFPLAIPILLLTAVALGPLLLPLALIFLAGGLIAAPFLAARRLVRHARGRSGLDGRRTASTRTEVIR